MKIVTGCDRAGFDLKQHLVAHLRDRGIEVEDLGSHGPGSQEKGSVDYPDYAIKVGDAVAAGAADFGLLCCGTGQGMAMTANRIPGIRAAVCADTFSAHATREHNDANVLCLGGRVVGPSLAADILDAFVHARFEGGRHAPRVDKIMALDKR